MKPIPYGHQQISAEDIAAVVEVLQSDWLTQGPMVTSFEEHITKYCHAQFGVATCNAGAALFLACRALDIKHGDYVWTSPNTFVASANCAVCCGATIDFVDIDPKTYNLCTKKLAAKLQKAKEENKLPKLIIPVHFSGQSCDMRAIRKLANQYGFFIIEDAAHAIGGKYLDENIGSCAYSDMTVFSFHPVKIITTGEGGMVTTNNKELYDKLKMLVTYGITRNPEKMQGELQGPWYYQQFLLGMNYRLTDFQCALGLSQLQRIDKFVEKRRELAARYDELLQGLPLTIPFQGTDVFSAYHLYVIQLQLEKLQKTRRQIFEELRAAEIGVSVHYIPVHLQPYFKQFGFKENDFPVAENYYQRAITLPLYPALTNEQQDYVVQKLQQLLL